ncbi:TetR/AcrR family transcriptional regulator [Microbacterium sp. KUDC0406]|uniref:TetR/AcrR family transcriptional regulator n=1 Tax=Microbacterium sp. KUDC0406 TaxID=2909588 RepID=UPI001F470A9A|nr:TetR/AcrR family transcriptional regulator [Microbacterium sp. KUDC0406]UJP08794.1 TetR/AcrR family transcriptional regulator [Microbacterium sp. KUDC0406]
MARPIVHTAELRDRLLDVTAAMVDAKGPERISLREIAQASDTSTSAVYALFGGKAQLLVAVIDHGFTSFGAAQAETESAGLRALGRAYRTWAKANPALYRLMFGGAITAAADCATDADVATAAMTPLVRALALRVPATQVMPAAMTVWAQVHGAVSLELADVAPQVSDWDALYDAVLDTVERAFPLPAPSS